MGPLSVFCDAHVSSQLVIFLLIWLMVFFCQTKVYFYVVRFISHLLLLDFWVKITFSLHWGRLSEEVLFSFTFCIVLFWIFSSAFPLGWVLGCGVRSLFPFDCPVVHNPFSVKRLPQWLGIPDWNCRFLRFVSGICPSHRSSYLWTNTCCFSHRGFAVSAKIL